MYVSCIFTYLKNRIQKCVVIVWNKQKVQANFEQYDIKLDVKIFIQIIKTSTLSIDMNSIKYVERNAVSLFQKLKVNFMAWSIRIIEI